jgi:hypothetical protein
MTRGTSCLVWGTQATVHSARDACFRLAHTETRPSVMFCTVCSISVFASFSVIGRLRSGVMSQYVIGRTLLIGMV